jgi:hypothetical protein
MKRSKPIESLILAIHPRKVVTICDHLARMSAYTGKT